MALWQREHSLVIRYSKTLIDRKDEKRRCKSKKEKRRKVEYYVKANKIMKLPFQFLEDQKEESLSKESEDL